MDAARSWLCRWHLSSPRVEFYAWLRLLCCTTSTLKLWAFRLPLFLCCVLLIAPPRHDCYPCMLELNAWLYSSNQSYLLGVCAEDPFFARPGLQRGNQLVRACVVGYAAFRLAREFL